jgi:DNA-binding IclR family transcriptional regulator
VAEGQLMVELDQIRRQGYAITCGEGILGAMGISAPVMNYSCPVVLTILGPENRIRSRKASLIKELLKSAGNLSRNIAEFIEQKSAYEETDVHSP